MAIQAPYEYQILAAIQTILSSTVQKADDYWHDLADQVFIGKVPGENSSLPRVVLTLGGSSSEFGSAMTRVKTTLIVEVLAEVEYEDADTTDARTLAALRIRQDIVRALELPANRRLGIVPSSSTPTVYTHLITAIGEVLDEVGYQKSAMVVMTMRVDFERDRGST